MSRKSASTAGITAAEVRAWFQKAAQRRPCPTEAACSQLARLLDQWRRLSAKNYKTHFGSDSFHIRKAVTACTVALTKKMAWWENIQQEYGAFYADYLATLQKTHSARGKTLRNETDSDTDPVIQLTKLIAAIKNARRFWEFPPRPAHRQHSKWHAKAVTVAILSRQLWLEADPNTPLPLNPVAFVVSQAMARALRIHLERETIASALKRIPATRLLWPPKPKKGDSSK
jgi:hypothetical protein